MITKYYNIHKHVLNKESLKPDRVPPQFWPVCEDDALPELGADAVRIILFYELLVVVAHLVAEDDLLYIIRN